MSSGVITRAIAFGPTGGNTSRALAPVWESRGFRYLCIIDNGHEIPPPSAREGAEYIAPSARTQSALLVRRARADRSLADLARALETSWPAAERLEDPHHSPTIKQLERAAAALGKRLVLVFE